MRSPGNCAPCFRRVWIGAAVLLAAGLGFLSHQLAVWQVEEKLLASWRDMLEPVVQGPSDEWSRRRERTMSLVRRHKSVLLPFLVARLEPPDDRGRETLRRWLDHLPLVRWRPAALPDWSGMALECLEQLGPEARPAVKQLERKLQRPAAANKAAQALAAIGPETTPCLLRGLKSPLPDVRIAVLDALAQYSHPRRAEALPFLMRSLDDPEPRVQSAAAALLGTFPEVRSQVLEPIVELLTSHGGELLPASGPALGLALLGEEALIPMLELLEAATNRHVLVAVFGGLSVAAERLDTNSAFAQEDATFNSLRCYMNLKSLQLAWTLYAGKQKTAIDDLLQRLRHHPTPAVRHHVDTMLENRARGVPSALAPDASWE